jgi:hypothetical protein
MMRSSVLLDGEVSSLAVSNGCSFIACGFQSGEVYVYPLTQQSGAATSDGIRVGCITPKGMHTR